ncbi:unnamed protein product [Phytomonas sp. Hart1]|nr:unnamed protein product [Phytomonas sp. Hart1]|eukprot:CCW72255.1 unnamed protein product [Phytomonas sp. isolate Hart1]
MGGAPGVGKGAPVRAIIRPPSPEVFSAKTEAEVYERAAAAATFAAFQHSQRGKGLRRSSEEASTSCLSPLADEGAGGGPVSRQGPVPHLPSVFDVFSLRETTLGGSMEHSTSLRSNGSTRMRDGALTMMEMLRNRPDVVLPSPSGVTAARNGDVLSAKHVLVVDLWDALHSHHDPVGIFAAAPYFRIAPKLGIAGVSQANASAVRAIFNQISRTHFDGPLVWINLRDEPLIYISDAAYIVRSRSDPLKSHIIPNVTGRSIEMIEDKLKQEVLREARENGGNISVQVEVKDGVVVDQWTSAHSGNVQTLAEVFRSLALEHRVNQLHYYRLPITQNIGPKTEDFDFVLSACLEEPKAVMVFNCQTGRGRSSAMMQIASIVRFYQMCVKDISADVRVLRGNTKAPAFRTIQKLISLFPDGKLHERRVNILMDFTDSFYSMADHINEAFVSLETDPEEAMMRLQQYALFLAFSCYCEQRLWNFATKESFTEWLHGNADMELLILSIRNKLDDQLREEQIHLSTASGRTAEETEATHIIRHRHGNVLSSGRILCCLPIRSLERDGCTLRQLAPGVPVFTCARLSAADRLTLVREIRAAFPAEDRRPQRFHWLSLRAEPMVMINDLGYTLTEFNAPPTMTENGTTMHISWQAIEQIEDRLRRDALLEAQGYGGYLLLHHVDEEGNRTFEKVKVCSVRTLRSNMEDFARECNILYHRVPIPFSGQMLATDIDPLMRFLSECDDSQEDIFFINDPEGSTRASVVLNMVALYRASRICDLRSLQSPQDFIRILRVGASETVVHYATLSSAAPEAGETAPPNIEVLLASTICQMLTAGTLLNTVNAAITLGGSGPRYNILHLLDGLKKRMTLVGVNRPQCVLNALYCLRCYLLVLLSSLYLDEQGAYATPIPFSVWVSDHTEVNHIIKGLADRGEAALKYVPTENLMRADVSRRSGEVLTANFCLKADHFPGCQKKGLRPTICGAPNFRKVDFVNVYGVAMPTLFGLHNILTILGASEEPLAVYQGQSNDSEAFRAFAAPRLFDRGFRAEELQRPLRGSVVWVNLREEPILYVGDRPFVFRDLGSPYVNVELTGIHTSKIAQVEAQLKLDVLNEATVYGGKFLVHDEVVPGELVGIWETANEATVKTLWEVYAELEAKGFCCHMLRLPVTDEQSPAIGNFDELVAALLPHITEHIDRRETLSFVFNCQMGRGRTTTGMVICCLLVGLVMPEYYEELQGSYGFNPLYRDDAAAELWNGNYEVIVQLKRVLPLGRQAKLRVDLVINSCAMMQNLRTTIESFVEAARSPDNNEVTRAHAHHAGVHYLIRYFNLIAFEVYLEECYDRTRRRMTITFEEWMRQRPELGSLSATAPLR